MSQGARLTAVIVVVVVAAIGLYIAVMAPSGAPEAASVPAEEVPTAVAVADPAVQLDAPPSEAFGVPGASAPATPAPAAPATGAAPAVADASTPRPVAAPAGPDAQAAATRTAVTPPAAPAGRQYTIRSGDTLEAIARRELGDGQRWRAIVELNPGLDPKNLKVGRAIALPSGSGSEAPATAAAPKAGGGGEGSTYTVQKGDTLYGIARKLYGAASDADIRRIVEANRSSVPTKDAPLRPGMKLTIPPKK
jgi:nucleoid-associated protein YgaU